MSFQNFHTARTSFTLTIPSSGTTIASAGTALNGQLNGITAVVPAMDATTTLTLSIADADGTVLFSKASIAQSANTFIYIDANNMPLRVPLSGSHTVTLTSSITQTAPRTITVNLLISK